MREIKFRAKRQDNGEWIKSGTLVTFNNGDTTTIYLPKSPSHCDAWADENGNLTVMESSYYRVQADTLGQFIGEQDAEGNDIYEGDIVQHGGKLYEIRYHPNYARFAGVKPGVRFAVFSLKSCTVLGNVFDHPHMMDDFYAKDGGE